MPLEKSPYPNAHAITAMAPGTNSRLNLTRLVVVTSRLLGAFHVSRHHERSLVQHDQVILVRRIGTNR